MSSDYTIENCHCDLCGRPDMTEVRQEFADLFDGDCYRLGVPKSKKGSPLRLRLEAYKEKYRQVYDASAKKCFHFVADCGGDAIAICKTCLAGIVAEIEAKEKENT